MNKDNARGQLEIMLCMGRGEGTNSIFASSGKDNW
jgi:hypothetical protein